MTGEPPGTDPVVTFESVVDLLEQWEPDVAETGTAAGRLQGFLDRGLNADADTDSVLDRDVVERRRGSNEADVSVNGEIGVKLVGEVRGATVDEVNVTLSLLSDWYSFVAVYWLDPSPEGADYRRTIERKASAPRLDLRGLAFVAGDSDDPDDADRSAGPAGLVGLSAGVAGLVAMALAGVTVVGWSLVRVAGPAVAGRRRRAVPLCAGVRDVPGGPVAAAPSRGCRVGPPPAL